MPLYEYRCIKCKTVTGYMRSTDDRNKPAVCSECGGPAKRIFSRPQKIKPAVMTPEQIRRDPEVWK